MSTSLQQVALGLLQGASLEDKLRPFDVDALTDTPVVTSSLKDWPARDGTLSIHGGADRLPKLRDLHDVKARALCMHRFANHELQAMEMFAWATLLFTDQPESFRRGLMKNAADEQRHFRFYLGRLNAYGMQLGDEFLTGNFWAQAVSLKTPLSFLCAMGLTFENANLDFSMLYRDAFNQCGAAEDARVMQQVHDDEVGHVAWALSWFRRLKDPAMSDLEAYRANTPFPLGLHRAKGRNFSKGSRRKAGMEEPFIEATRVATSPQQEHPKRAVG